MPGTYRLRIESGGEVLAAVLTVAHAEPPHMEVVAMYDADDAAATDWVKRAEAVASEIWQKLAERRKGVVR